MSIHSRLDAIEKRGPGRSRAVVVMASTIDPDAPPISRFRRTVTLRVPEEFAEDPLAGLTGEQRAVIRPGDNLIVVAEREETADGGKA